MGQWVNKAMPSLKHVRVFNGIFKVEINAKMTSFYIIHNHKIYNDTEDNEIMMSLFVSLELK